MNVTGTGATKKTTTTTRLPPKPASQAGPKTGVGAKPPAPTTKAPVSRGMGAGARPLEEKKENTRPVQRSAPKFKGKAPVEEEKKEEKPKTGLFTEKPSAKLTGIKTADPFSTNKDFKINSFAYVYNAGGIPCRIDHGSIHNRLKWDTNVVLSELAFDPILVTCFEGLIESKHPYNFIAREAIKQLLESDDAADKVIPLLPRIVPPLRNAFGVANMEIFEAGLASLKQLSTCIGDALNPHVNGLIGQLVKKLNEKNMKEKIMETLNTLEENGGPDVVKIIKAKIPTYTNIT